MILETPIIKIFHWWIYAVIQTRDSWYRMDLNININSVTGETDFDATCDSTTTGSPAVNGFEPGKMHVTRQQVPFRVCWIILKQGYVCRIPKLFGNIFRRILLGHTFSKLLVNMKHCAHVILQKQSKFQCNYRHTCYVSRNKRVHHSDIVGAPPVGAAPTTSLFST